VEIKSDYLVIVPARGIQEGRGEDHGGDAAGEDAISLEKVMTPSTRVRMLPSSSCLLVAAAAWREPDGGGSGESAESERNQCN
jgi:hypothetical protein